MSRLLVYICNAPIDLQRLIGLSWVVRGVLGLLNALALMSYARAAQRAFGRRVANWYILLQATQFHVLFYASRTLPNMFAFALSKPFLVSVIKYTL